MILEKVFFLGLSVYSLLAGVGIDVSSSPRKIDLQATRIESLILKKRDFFLYLISPLCEEIFAGLDFVGYKGE